QLAGLRRGGRGQFVGVLREARDHLPGSAAEDDGGPRRTGDAEGLTPREALPGAAWLLVAHHSKNTRVITKSRPLTDLLSTSSSFASASSCTASSCASSSRSRRASCASCACGACTSSSPQGRRGRPPVDSSSRSC